MDSTKSKKSNINSNFLDSKFLDANCLDSNLNSNPSYTRANVTTQSSLDSKSKNNLKALDFKKDSIESTINPNCLNPKLSVSKFKSNLNSNPSYSRINAKTHSNSLNPKAYKDNLSVLNLKLLDSTQSTINPRIYKSNPISCISPKFSSSLGVLLLSLTGVLNAPINAQSWATSGTITLENSGTIDTITSTTGVNNTLKADGGRNNNTTKNFNSLIINEGVTLQNNGAGNTFQLSNKANVNTIENKGLIKRQNSSASVVAIENNATLGTFKNTGTIESVGNAVSMYINKVTISSIDLTPLPSSDILN